MQGGWLGPLNCIACLLLNTGAAAGLKAAVPSGPPDAASPPAPNVLMSLPERDLARKFHRAAQQARVDRADAAHGANAWDNATSVCASHGLTARDTPVAVVDIVRFNMEYDLLHLRVEEIGEHVSTMIPISSDPAGHPVPGQYKDVFGKLGTRMQLQVGSDKDVLPFLAKQHSKDPETIVLFSDANQIPSPHSLRLLKLCSGTLPMLLPTREFAHTFEWESVKPQKNGLRIVNAKQLLQTPTSLDLALDEVAAKGLFGDFTRFPGCGRVAGEPCAWQCNDCGATASGNKLGLDLKELEQGRCAPTVASGNDDVCRRWKRIATSAAAADLPTALGRQPDIFFTLMGKALDSGESKKQMDAARALIASGNMHKLDIDSVPGNRVKRDLTKDATAKIHRMAASAAAQAKDATGAKQ